MLNLNEIKPVKVTDVFTGEVISELKPYRQEINGDVIEVFYKGDEYEEVRFFTKVGELLTYSYSEQTNIYKAWLENESYITALDFDGFTATRRPWKKVL